MIGGQPVQPYYQPQPQSRPGLLPQRRQQTAGTKANQPQTAGVARPRMQSDDAPELAKVNERPALQMPSPEQLGLGAKARSVEVDWSAVRSRMEALKVASFNLQKLEGGFRFICVVPINGERRKIEADGVNEAEAIDLALGRAEARRGG